MKPKTLQRLLTAIFIMVLVQLACGQPSRRVRLVGYAMKPNFEDGAIFKIIEVPLSELERGDLVLIDFDGKEIIKRLIGLPNETISIANGKIHIDGTLLVEPYEVVPGKYLSEVKLGSDSYYVLGDNRPDSLDSHIFGPIKGNSIKGKAIPE